MKKCIYRKTTKFCCFICLVFYKKFNSIYKHNRYISEKLISLENKTKISQKGLTILIVLINIFFAKNEVLMVSISP